jgi:hypothetical protein
MVSYRGGKSLTDAETAPIAKQRLEEDNKRKLKDGVIHKRI